jgi:hypothetical protein
MSPILKKSWQKAKSRLCSMTKVLFFFGQPQEPALGAVRSGLRHDGVAALVAINLQKLRM